MPEAIVLPPPMTIAAFDAFLAAQRDDAAWELVEGRIVAMTNPSLVHAEIVGNMGGALRPVLPADRRCRLTMGDVRVQSSDDAQARFASRPDVMVNYRLIDVGWELRTLTRPDESLVFEALTFATKLSEVYGGVDLPSR